MLRTISCATTAPTDAFTLGIRPRTETKNFFTLPRRGLVRRALSEAIWHSPELVANSINFRISARFCQVRRSVQPSVFGSGGDEDRNAEVGVFPQRQEILIRCTGLDGVALQGIGTGNPKIR